MNEPTEACRDPALSRLYQKHASGEPPAALDAAILEHAQQALAHKKLVTRSWWQRFSAPLALAATLTLALLITLNIERQTPEWVPPPIVEEQAPAPVEQRQPTPPSQVKPSADPPVAAARETALPTPPSRTPTHTRAPAPSGKPPSPFPAAQPATPSAAGAAPAHPTQTEADETARPLSRGGLPAQEENLMPQEKRRTVAPTTKAAARTPEIWIEEIRELRRQKKWSEAERSLTEFRRAYPDYRLPEDLR
ncbi:MAG: hypothetical protein BWY57_01178 [Betaproteobacteria bacterium ADurb.Bin341]|nr:MAG: hypothetical protein BWY57_01178 [Betaproteobacteria bacterium ADurb.Bin341]